MGTKKRNNKNKDGPNDDDEIIEQDLENVVSESEYEYESENESEYGEEKISSDFEYESDSDAEQSDIDSDCRDFEVSQILRNILIAFINVEKVLKGSLDSIPSSSPS